MGNMVCAWFGPGVWSGFISRVSPVWGRLNVGGPWFGLGVWSCLFHCPWYGPWYGPGKAIKGEAFVPVPDPGMALSLYKGVALLFQVEQGKAVLGL